MGTQQAWAAPTVPIRTGRDWEKGAKVWGTARRWGVGGRRKGSKGQFTPSGFKSLLHLSYLGRLGRPLSLSSLVWKTAENRTAFTACEITQASHLARPLTSGQGNGCGHSLLDTWP